MSDVCADAKSVTGVAVKNSVPILPTRFIWCGTPAATAAAERPAASRPDRASSPGYGSVRCNSVSVAMPAAIATGFPDSVPAWNTGPAGITCRITSARPP